MVSRIQSRISKLMRRHNNLKKTAAEVTDNENRYKILELLSKKFKITLFTALNS